ncbi:hypothetical protein DERP_008085, partial [Dermatophagoides pteronyssinus]
MLNAGGTKNQVQFELFFSSFFVEKIRSTLFNGFCFEIEMHLITHTFITIICIREKKTFLFWFENKKLLHIYLV